MMSFFEGLDTLRNYDNNWVTSYPMGEDFVVASEGDIVYRFDPVTLEAKNRVREE